MQPTNESERLRLIDAYLSYAKSLCRDEMNDADYWAVDVVRDIVARDAEAAWPIVLELIGRAEDDEVLAFIAAGPLEDLLIAHGPQLIDRIEARAATDKTLRRALSGVWGESQMSDLVLQRLKLLVRDEPPF